MRVRRVVHGARLGELAPNKDPGYEKYLKAQLTRSLTKDDGQLLPRARRLIDAVAQHLIQDRNSHILCIGCRNTAEIDYLHEKGFRHVAGIDLFSPRSDIQVMDMHAMSFTSDCFDLVYASHSLEHALEPARVIDEITRVAKPGGIVAIEVPLGFTLTSVDLVDYGTIDGLLARFSSAVRTVLWSETRPAGAVDGSGTPIGRVIFRIDKPVR